MTGFTPAQLDSFAGTLNSIPFVRWDRCIPVPEVAEGHWLFLAYGWIDRHDDHHDFVTIEFSSWNPLPIPTTSSAERSAEIARLCGHAPDGHSDCERIEQVLPAVQNAVRLVGR